jgi:predicted polyphosphate/ATP-dependent NAD kinase
MVVVGIIVNPDSGRDVRRIISQAMTVSNEQKLNIVARVLVALETVGVERVEIMPDRFGIGGRALDMLAERPIAQASRLIDMPATWSADDTLHAANALRESGAGCIVVLGGDGTCRLVAKACGDVPLMPISTGTNNVVPDFVEGTIAGLAAGFVALHPERREALCWQHKRLIVYVDGREVDVALVDVALVDQAFTGAKAVWDVGALRQLFVTRAHPTRIGLSSVLGHIHPVAVDAPHGAVAELNNGSGQRVLAPVVPGGFARIAVSALRVLQAGERVRVEPIRPAILALDGEREIVLRPGSAAEVALDRAGPWMVDVERTLAQIVAEQLFVDHNP